MRLCGEETISAKGDSKKLSHRGESPSIHLPGLYVRSMRVYLPAHRPRPHIHYAIPPPPAAPNIPCVMNNVINSVHVYTNPPILQSNLIGSEHLTRRIMGIVKRINIRK